MGTSINDAHPGVKKSEPDPVITLGNVAAPVCSCSPTVSWSPARQTSLPLNVRLVVKEIQDAGKTLNRGGIRTAVAGNGIRRR
jgi:hypothetical protein